MSELESALPVEAAEALIVRPGDTLILRFGSDVSLEQVKTFRGNTKLKERLPGVEVIMIGGGIEQMVIYRPNHLAEGG